MRTLSQRLRPASSLGLPRARLSLGPGTFLFAALLAVNGSNVLLHALAAHVLGPVAYGALAALLGIALAVSLPAGALQIALTGGVARNREAGEETAVTSMGRRLTFAGLGLAAGLLLATPALGSYLHLESPVPLVWLALYCLPLAAGIAPWSYLCGTRRFRPVALAVIAGAGVRITGGAAVLLGGHGVAGVMAVTLLGECVLAGALAVAARRAGWGAGRQLSLRLHEAVGAVLAVAGLSLLVSLDTVLARHYLTPAAAGLYAATALAARVALFLPQAVAVVALPSLASLDRARAKRALRSTLLAATGLGLAAGTALVAGSDTMLPLVFGESFQPRPLLVALLALTAMGAGVLNVLLQYHLVQRSRTAATAWIGVTALPLLALLWHDSPSELAAVAIVAIGMAVAPGLVASQRSTARAARPALAAVPASPPPELDLTVVVPFHAVATPVKRCLHSLERALREAGVSFEVIAVADGCGDHGDAVGGLDPERLRCFALDRRSGKGEALRVGLRQGRGRYLGFIDADGDLDPELWKPFLGLMALYRPDAIVGSKLHPLSDVEAPPLRRLYSRGYRWLTRLLFRLPVRDTQVGIKVFRRELLEDVLPRTVERGFVFDLEVLVVARRLGYRRLLEAPVSLSLGDASTVRARTVVSMLLATVALAWRLHSGGYDHATDPGGSRPLGAHRQSATRADLALAASAPVVGGSSDFRR